MKYDFTSIIDRQGFDAIAVESVGVGGGFAPDAPKEGFDFIPMWVADMNFATVPTIQEEIIKRAQHPCFGYFNAKDEYYNSIFEWQKRHNGVEGLTKENIGYENGVLGGVVSALNVLCSKGDAVLLHSPTYVGFTGSLTNNGYKIVHSPLYLDENNVWRMDYADMEKKIVENHIHAAIFCSPYNPVGRVWEKEEIEKAMEVYRKHDVYVVSDEIWSDIIMPGYKHTPTQSVSEDAKMRTIALYAPSKTFNLAGLIGSYHIIYNSYLKERIDKESSLSHYNSMNVFSQYALIGAYKEEGYQWLGELLEVLSKNIDYGYDFVCKNLDGVTLSKPQGTYMLFIDCEEYCKKHNVDIETVLKRGWDYGVGWQDGRMFHGPYHIRLNLALPYSRVVEAFDRMKKYIFVED